MDTSRAEAFGERLVGILNSGSVAVMISIGHRTGLFDRMATLPPSTSEEIAAAAGLNERYVREWLAALYSGDIIEYDPATRRFWIDEAHQPMLTRAGESDNLAPFMQYVSYFGTVEDGIIEAFRNGGGVSYDQMPRFQALMEEDSGQSVLPALIDIILPIVPGLRERLSQGIDVLDLGSGRGRALNLLAEHFPNSRFTGIDISQEGVDYATEYAREHGLRNVQFRVADAATFAAGTGFDLITTFDAIHDQKDPAAVLSRIYEALRPDGVYLMQDIRSSVHLEKNKEMQPLAATLYTVSTLHCMTVSLAVGGAGLGTMWGEEKAREMLADAGFTSVSKHELAHDFQNNWYVITK